MIRFGALLNCYHQRGVAKGVSRIDRWIPSKQEPHCLFRPKIVISEESCLPSKASPVKGRAVFEISAIYLQIVLAQEEVNSLWAIALCRSMKQVTTLLCRNSLDIRAFIKKVSDQFHVRKERGEMQRREAGPLLGLVEINPVSDLASIQGFKLPSFMLLRCGLRKIELCMLDQCFDYPFVIFLTCNLYEGPSCDISDG